MREHEVPTHVQAEDKVLLWFTFPQIVAVVAVCALAYGAYRYFPIGPAGVPAGHRHLPGDRGHRHDRGQGGRPGAAAGGRRPAEVQPGGQALRRVPAGDDQGASLPRRWTARPDPLRLLAKKAASGVGRAVKAAQRKGRQPFRPHSWFGKRRNRNGGNGGNGPNPNQQESKNRKPWNRLLAVAALGLLAVVLLPSAALADGPGDEDPGWRLDEIYFVPPDPVPGRRIFVERLAVTGDTADVTLRAAHDLDLKVRVFGGRSGRTLKMGANAIVHSGERKDLQPDPRRPVAVLHLLLDGLPGLLRGGFTQEQPDSLPPAPGRRGAVRPGNDLPGVDGRAASAASSPRSASPTPGRKLTCRSTAATSARPRPPCWTLR